MTETTTSPVRELTPTEQSVLEQLLENTGRHMLDSGGAYGRSWERNQAAGAEALLARPATTVSFKYGIDVTHQLVHWLPERVEYQLELDSLFQRWAEAEAGDSEVYRFDQLRKEKRADTPWLQNASEWAELLGGTGIYGDGAPVVVNTYNGEDLLSQTLQYVYFTVEADVPLVVTPVEAGGIDVELEGDEDEPLLNGQSLVTWPAGEYVLLQVHGGADVRGGYTRPRVYTTAFEEQSLFDNARAELYCSRAWDAEAPCQTQQYGEATRWYTDDGYHWYSDSSELPELDKLERLEVDTDTLPPAEERVGQLVVDTAADVAYCPVCGAGTLQASAY